MNGGFECQSCHAKFLYSATLLEVKSVRYGTVRKTVEKRCCPFCLSLNFERVENAKIKGIQDVPYQKANELIEKGYDVAGVYSGHVVLVKKEAANGG